MQIAGRPLMKATGRGAPSFNWQLGFHLIWRIRPASAKRKLRTAGATETR